MKLKVLGQELTQDELRFLGFNAFGVPKIAFLLFLAGLIIATIVEEMQWFPKYNAWGVFGLFCVWLVCGISGAEIQIENYRKGLIKQQRIKTEPKPSRHYTRRLKGESDEEYLIRILEKQAKLYGGADAIYKRLQHYYDMYELDRKTRTPKGLRCKKERKDV
ncbi:hypothetical protein [Campylobacter concisus]|jgi:hypothetical protein|uniref:hypothetical protein n=1 Tax=Campylobacter concisus TaxID=199 RepID=UPI000D395295|nr:hypothetical protein [Campylobacter concisus]QPH88674.1 hypothetical protein CVT15_08180 [Campylobacter concisus]